MVNRLHHGIEIKNNLLEQIKLEYADLFLATEDSAKEICSDYGLPPLTEDEVGFFDTLFCTGNRGIPTTNQSNDRLYNRGWYVGIIESQSP